MSPFFFFFLREADASFHPGNGLGFGVPQKVEGFVVGLIAILEFSPESLQGVAVLVANPIPQRIVFPIGFDMLDKLWVFFPFFMEDFMDDKRSVAGRA